MGTVNLIECIVTWQGEGSDAGKRMLLCRFKKCNRVCKWCDTLVKMRVQQEASYELTHLQTIIDKHKCGLMITGGEPTYDDQYFFTKDLLEKLNYPYANVETNGHALKSLLDVVPRIKPVTFVYSPKFFTPVELDLEFAKTSKVYTDSRVIIKLVYQDTELIHQYLEYIEDLPGIHEKVFLMPEGTTKDKLIENAGITFDAAEKYRFGFSSRDHIIYGFV